MTFYALAQHVEDQGASDVVVMQEARRRSLATTAALEQPTAAVVVEAPSPKTPKTSDPSQAAAAKAEGGAGASASGADTTPLDDGEAFKERHPFRRLMAMQGLNKALLALGMIAAVGTAGGPLTIFIFITEIFTVLFSRDIHNMQAEGGRLAATIFSIVGGVAIASVTEYGSFGIAGAKLTLRLRRDSMNALLRQHVGFFDNEKNSAGQLVAFLGEKIILVQALNGERLQTMVRSIATIAVAITFLAIYGSWQLFLAVVSIVPPLVCMVIIAKKLGGEKNNKGQSLKSKGRAARRTPRRRPIARQAISSARLCAPHGPSRPSRWRSASTGASPRRRRSSRPLRRSRRSSAPS